MILLYGEIDPRKKWNRSRLLSLRGVKLLSLKGLLALHQQVVRLHNHLDWCVISSEVLFT